MTLSTDLALPAINAVATDPEIILEFMLARLLTPIMSDDFHRRFRRLQASPKPTTHQQGGLEHLLALPSMALLPPSAIAQGTAIDLRRHTDQGDDVNLIGVYGMNVDEEGNIWFSTNHLSIVHKLDGEFNLLEQHIPKGDLDSWLASRRINTPPIIGFCCF